MISKDDFRTAVFKSIKQIKSLNTVNISDDENFTVVGLDSLDAMDLVIQVETITGLDFGELDPAKANTINSFYQKACELK
ncbi:MAG: acyl carrier protein [Burkholderiaceae bacterium]|nr:MAG: acyl carrier protein [Burkholderiaceae bacterium]